MYTGVAITVILTVGLILFFIDFETKSINTKQMVLISALSAAAALGRIPFAGLPSVQPTTFIVIISGYVLGPRSGFMVGTVAAVVSNFFLGQGPWTPWQMAAWGLAGMSAGILGRIYRRPGRLQLVVFCGVWGYLFGWFMNLWTFISYVYPHDIKAYLMLCGTSFWFDSLHAAGNVVLSLVIGRELLNIVHRFRQKMVVNIIK